MSASHLKHLAKQVCPVPFWTAARGLYISIRARRAAGRSAGEKVESQCDKRRVVRTLEEVDRVFAEAVKVYATSDAAFRATLDAIRFDPGIALPLDADSPEYKLAQLELYALISGQSDYQPKVNEQVEIDYDDLLARPHPYWSGNPTAVGEQLMAIGFMIRAMDLRRGERILEFGPGSGTSTLEFAKMGHPITAVDINPLYTRVVDARARQLGLNIETVCSEMLTYQPEGRFDRIVFYECFHHCSDHLRLIERFDGMLNPGGAVVFAGEPIHDFFLWPWGLRMDGLSLWAIRTQGWLELGFQRDYFVRTMARHGWTTTLHKAKDISWQEVYIARRTAEVAR